MSYICEYCGNHHDGSYGSGRFCSKSCRMRFIGSQSNKNGKLTGHPRSNTRAKKIHYCLHCHKELKERHQTYCSYICQNEHKHSEYIRKWKNGEVSGVVGEYGISIHIRQYLFQKYGSKCSRCGWHEVNPYTGKIPLEIEHIDGNYMNNSESNLDLICPNCHSLTSTYKVLNWGHGRKARKKYG